MWVSWILSGGYWQAEELDKFRFLKITNKASFFKTLTARKKHLRKTQVLFSTKFALRASEIALLWNICFANVKYSPVRMWQTSFHIDGVKQGRYFTMCCSAVFHMERQRDSSLLLHQHHQGKYEVKMSNAVFRPAVRIGPVALTSDRFFDIMFILENHNSQRGEYGITNSEKSIDWSGTAYHKAILLGGCGWAGESAYESRNHEDF